VQNEARRRRRQNSELADLLEMLADVQNDIPSPPNAEVLQAIIEEAQRALYQDEWKTCAVCDEEAELPLPGEGTLFRTLAPSALPPRAFNVLQPRPDHTYTDELMSQYNVSSCFSAPADQAVLQEIFLSRGHRSTKRPPQLPALQDSSTCLFANPATTRCSL